jgi:hypothetical protein
MILVKTTGKPPPRLWRVAARRSTGGIYEAICLGPGCRAGTVSCEAACAGQWLMRCPEQLTAKMVMICREKGRRKMRRIARGSMSPYAHPYGKKTREQRLRQISQTHQGSSRLYGTIQLHYENLPRYLAWPQVKNWREELRSGP